MKTSGQLNAPHADLSGRYLTSLRLHLRGERMRNGDRAQGFGRVALASGLATLDLARMHAEALATLASTSDFTAAPSHLLKRSGLFLTQALIPLEAAQRATREANRLLLQRNETLRLHTAALAKVNRQLERAITRRLAAEVAILEAKGQYQKLFLASQVMQKKLRELTRQIISAQEQERKDISRELHDEVVQPLVGINVHLAALSKGSPAGLRTLKAKIARTQRLVENSVNAVHRFARELRPAVLDDLGLIPALHAYSKGLAARKKIKIYLTAFAGVETLEIARRTILFRVAQEALTNVVRHAQATEVRLSLTEIPGAVRMEIGDNGRSFPVEKVLQAKNRKRLGLVGMRERMEMVGGSLAIESAPGKGTTVRAEIPFQSGKEKS
ncbi:MAG TPA: sensor histidine kinase [Opitutaceae bacterium]|nr:sensor histidine kinase [Opitutaceae bacterium]